MERLENIPGRWAAIRPDAPALVDTLGSRTWAELEGAVATLSSRLKRHGVLAGDRVMIVGENSAVMVALLFAVSALDAWIVNVNARLTAREIEAIRKHSQARSVLYLVEASPDAALHAARADTSLLETDGWGMVLMTPADGEVAAEAPAGVAAVVYTTGTTSEPKGVMLTHSNLLFVARAGSSLRGLTPEDRVFGVLPMSHVYGLSSVCLGSLLAGSTIYLKPRFTPESMESALVEDRVTICQGVPAMYAKYVEYLVAQGRDFVAPALRAIYCGGSPLTARVKRTTEAIFGLTLHNGYGLTEAAPTLTQTRHEAPRKDCSVGLPLPGVELRIMNPDGTVHFGYDAGELWARGPNIMKGYYRDPEGTAAALKPRGWLATGDLARIDREGSVHIEGRLKELIIRSGFNVHPAEVEAVLNTHPEVSQSAVVGREVEGNEEVVAFVELVQGARADEGALIEFAAAALAAYKRPARVIVMDKLPAAASGKILKSRLKELALSSAAPTAPAR
jgi:acyl-CoA synthetase (AMP-forming)/AMP-acid ligase II